MNNPINHPYVAFLKWISLQHPLRVVGENTNNGGKEFDKLKESINKQITTIQKGNVKHIYFKRTDTHKVVVAGGIVAKCCFLREEVSFSVFSFLLCSYAITRTHFHRFSPA